MTLLRLERDPDWWRAVYGHPAVRANSHTAINDDDLVRVVSDPKVLPLASAHGGFWFLQRDGLGTVYELHAAYTPEGWGREVTTAMQAALEKLFSASAQLLFTWEFAGKRTSRPPLSHGWRTAGPFQQAEEVAAEVRVWTLTRDAWERSPARRRLWDRLSRR